MFSQQILRAVSSDTAPRPVCPMKHFSGIWSCSSASSFSPQSGCMKGQYHAWAESSPCRTANYGDWVSERAKLCPFWALCPLVSPWTTAGSVTVGATGSCWAGVCSATPWVPLFGKKKIDEFWNMFISCSLHLVVVSINMPLTHAH